MEMERSAAMTYKWFTSRFTKKGQKIDNAADSRHREPLDHPELSHMTLRELADLPMPSYTMENCNGSIRII
jgi:hypothetical protein